MNQTVTKRIFRFSWKDPCHARDKDMFSEFNAIAPKKSIRRGLRGFRAVRISPIEDLGLLNELKKIVLDSPADDIGKLEEIIEALDHER